MLSIPHQISFDQVEKIEMGRACSTHGTRGRTYRILVGKPEGRRPVVRLRRRWEDVIKWILKKLNGDHGLDRCG
jgi:hypothetical protein